MKYIAICPIGLEDITILEIKEILGVEAKKVISGRVSFETKEIETLKEKTQSLVKIYEEKQRTKDIEEIKTFPIASPFRVVCIRKGDHLFTSQYVEKTIGEKFYKEGAKVDLSNPKTIVLIDIIDEDIFVGIDETPKLLSKREYRIKVQNQSINACIAYGLVRLSGYEKEKTLLDPYARDGVIAIEALLFQEGNIFAYAPQFPSIRAIEINAKLAGVRKKIKLSRTEIEWLDTKFKKEEIDYIVSALPFPSKTQKESVIKKMYEELFYNIEYILKSGGKLVCIAPSLTLLKEMNKKLTLLEERKVGISQTLYDVLVFKKH